MIADPTQHWLHTQPASDRAANGDFADFFQIGLDRHAFVVGDLAGTGRAAASAATALLSYAQSALRSPAPLRTVLERLDGIFTRTIASERVPFASLFIAVSDSEDRVLEYASAGHEPALHFTSHSRHEHLGPTGPLLGLSGLLKPAFTQARVHLGPESALVIVTDGITEARRYERREPAFFGSSGVARAFAAAQRARRDPAEAIAGAARTHAGRALGDDATVLVVQPRRLMFPYHQPHF